MSDFIAAEDRDVLVAHQLDNFDALWALELEAVDAPNTARGGYSTVSRLQLGERAYYLKRQSNYLTRSLFHPFGEPTFARELRNIQHYQQLQNYYRRSTRNEKQYFRFLPPSSASSPQNNPSRF